MGLVLLAFFDAGLSGFDVRPPLPLHGPNVCGGQVGIKDAVAKILTIRAWAARREARALGHGFAKFLSTSLTPTCPPQRRSADEGGGVRVLRSGVVVGWEGECWNLYAGWFGKPQATAGRIGLRMV